MKTESFFLAMVLAMFVPGGVFGQQKPSTGYAPVNGLKMYYEIHGQGEPVVLLHGAFMAVTDEWSDFARELSKTRKVIAVEMQGHGRTADIKRDITYENLAERRGRAARLSEDTERGRRRLQPGRGRGDRM